MLVDYAKRGFQDPFAGIAYLTRGRKGVGRLFLNRLLGVDGERLDALHRDLHSDPRFDTHLRTSLKATGRYLGEMGSAEVLYLAVRVLRPRILVETGVAAGLSSAFILKGVEDNGFGVLHSVDLPNYEIDLAKQGLMEKPIAVIPEGTEPGFLVPSYLKTHWRLHIGKTRHVLEPLLRNLMSIDFFLHDSEHSYKNMFFEYGTAWGHLKEGGILLSHDIYWNRAFFDFALNVGRKPLQTYFSGIGGLRK